MRCGSDGATSMVNTSKSFGNGAPCQAHVWPPSAVATSRGAPLSGSMATATACAESVCALARSMTSLAPGTPATTCQSQPKSALVFKPALVATAMGLAAAIPAAIFYNHFGNVIREFGARMEDFSMEFMNLAERSFED